MELPDDLHYSPEHEWLRLEGSTARVGITDYAQDALGDVVFVDLPDEGLEVVAGASCCEVESTKAVSEVYAPLSGTITAVNSTLEEAPERVNSDPYGKGWIFELELLEPSDVRSLLDPAAYRALTDG